MYLNIKPILLVLLTLGIILGCETQDPLIRDARDSIQSQDFERAIEITNKALEADSSNALAHYYQATAYGSMAEDVEPPSDRKKYYEDMVKSMNLARKFFEEMEDIPDEYEMISDVINSVWANEHNAGADIMINDSLRQATENPEQKAMAHFENAITIQPDSALSYSVLSSILFNTGDIERATSVFEQAMARMDNPEIEDYDYLINLYFMQNRYQDALELSEEAREAYPEEDSFVQYLADSYLQTGEPDRAIELIRGLIENDPDNPQYYFVLGTQIYQASQRLQNEATTLFQRAWQMEEQLSQLTPEEQEGLKTKISELIEEATDLEEEAIEMENEAIEEIKTSLELRPDDDGAYNVLGIIYQNRAAAVFDKRNNVRDDNQLALEYDKQAREKLELAMENYEEAAELNPEETNYWEALFQVYTNLNMQEEANEAMEKAGIE